MTANLHNVPTEELEKELRQRGAAQRCYCNKWMTRICNFDEDGECIRCCGCMKAIGKCVCF